MNVEEGEFASAQQIQVQASDVASLLRALSQRLGVRIERADVFDEDFEYYVEIGDDGNGTMCFSELGSSPTLRVTEAVVEGSRATTSIDT